MGQEDYRELSSFLVRFIGRLKWVKTLEGLCLIGISLLLLFSLGLGIREIKAVFPYAPMVYALLTAVLLLLLLGRMLFQWLRRISQEWAALYIEKKIPHLRNNLINSLQLYPEIANEKQPKGISSSMVLALLRATRRQLHNLRVEELINTKQVKTNVVVENGGTVVLGGIYTQEERNDITKVPFLGDIPLFGNLFKSTGKTNNKTELLIFITPKIQLTGSFSSQ